MTDHEAEALNRRRIELVEKKARGEITADELIEFMAAQEQYFAWLDRKHPLPPSQTADIDRIERRLES